MPGVKQPCPMVAACWSPAMPQNADRAAEQIGQRLAEVGRAIAAPPATGRPGRANSRSRSWSQAPRRDIEQQRARRIGGVGGVDLAAGQPPEQERIHRAERKPALLGRRARAIHVVEQPADLGRREIRIEHQAGFVRDRGLVPGGAQRRAGVGGAPVLPDDGVMDRLAVDAIPDDRGLALVGDADAGDILGVDGGLGHGLAHGRDHARPDFLRIVLDPSRRRIDLAQFLLRDGDRRELGVEHDRPRRGGALIDGDEVGRHGADADAFYDRLKGGRRLRRPGASPAR